MSPNGDSPADPSTAVRRLSEKQRDDAAALTDVLSSGLLAHVGFQADGGWPYVIPVAYAPWRDGVIFHGSTGSRMFRAMASGARICATVTHLDALVLARSAFESSMSYRSAMLFGVCQELAGDEKSEALDVLTDHLLPGRRFGAPNGLRPPTGKELAATMVLYLPADKWSVKVGNEFADDPAADLASHADLWAGQVAVRTSLGPAEPDSTAIGLPVPAEVAAWIQDGHPALAGPVAPAAESAAEEAGT